MTIRPSRALPSLLVLASLGCGAAEGGARAPVPPGPVLSVLTYNVNFGIAGDPETVRAIQDAEADLVLLQETNASWEEALRNRLSGNYPYMDYHHCCGAGGLAVLSKAPFETTEPIDPPEGGWFPAWRLVVQSKIGPLQVLNVHLRPAISDSGSVVSGYFSTPPVRRAQIEAYWEHVDPGVPTIVAGDFNEGSTGRAIDFLQDRGFRSALPEHEGQAPTWRWPTSVGTLHAQLDHIVYDPRLEAVDVRVIHRGRSDHLPVLAVFRRP